MFDLASIKTDKKLVNEGVWVDNVLPGLDVKVISPSSSAFKKYAQNLLKPYQQLGKEPDMDESETLGAQSFAYVITKDWRSHTDIPGETIPFAIYAGEQIPFSPENALRLFTEVPEFLQAVGLATKNLDNFREKKKLDVEGN